MDMTRTVRERPPILRHAPHQPEATEQAYQANEVDMYAILKPYIHDGYYEDWWRSAHVKWPYNFLGDILAREWEKKSVEGIHGRTPTLAEYTQKRVATNIEKRLDILLAKVFLPWQVEALHRIYQGQGDHTVAKAVGQPVAKIFQLTTHAKRRLAPSTELGHLLFGKGSGWVDFRYRDIDPLDADIYVVDHRYITIIDRSGVNTLRDLLSMTQKDISAIDGLGPKRTTELQEVLARMGYSLRAETDENFDAVKPQTRLQNGVKSV